MQCWINIHMASWGQVKVLYRRADYQSPRPLGQTSIFIYIVRFFYIRKAFHRNEISFSSFYRLKIFSGKKYFYSVSGVYITAVKLARKLVNFLKGENLLNFWHSFVAGLKVLVFKKTIFIFHDDFCYSGMDIYHKECLWSQSEYKQASAFVKDMIQTIPIQ